MNTRQKILAFLNAYTTCVLATSGGAGPEAATVGFSVTPELELTIGTSKNSRKYQNILHNAHVAVVVGLQGDVTVQYEGTARELTGQELAVRKALHLQRVPGAKVYENEPDQIYLSVTPTWARYTDYTQPEPIEEIRQSV